MKHVILLLAIALSAGCGSTRPDKAEFSIVSEENDLFLCYKSATPFIISLTADEDDRAFPNDHPAGEGRIRIFLDKGAVWLSENQQGYGMLAPIARPSFLHVEEMISIGSNVFPVAKFQPEGYGQLKVYVKVVAREEK